jgi:hypothetical protein
MEEEKEQELEFASKEDLDLIKGNPQLERAHKAMLAGVNKKFQSWSEEKKTLQKNIDNLTTQVKQLDGGLAEWEDWFTSNKEKLTKFAQSEEGEGEEMRTQTKERRKKDEGTDKRYEELVEALNQAGRQFQGEMSKMQKMLNYSMQLNELYRRNPKLDGAKVLDVALKKGYQDLTRAYEDVDAYGEDILNEKVEERLKPRLDEELAKRRTLVESGSGAIPTKFELGKEIPKSFEAAGIEFLQERSKEVGQSQSQNPPLGGGGKD